MKRTIGALVVLLALLAFGCDDSEVTTPPAPDEPQPTGPTVINLVPSASTRTLAEGPPIATLGVALLWFSGRIVDN